MIKQIPNLNNYFVDEEGNVYSSYHQKLRKLKPIVKNGYCFVNVVDDNGKRTFTSIHRLVALTFITNNDLSKCEVNHKNHIRSDNRVENLEWISHTDNVRYSRKMPCKLVFDDGIIEEFSHIADMNRKYQWTTNIRF